MISAAASVPGTTTVCSSRAAKMSSTRRSAILGAFGCASVTSRRRPAFLNWLGEPKRSSSVRTAEWSNRGPRTRVDLGEQAAQPVLDPGHLTCEVVVKAGIISSSATVSSDGARLRRVCGIARAASAMIAASRASVFDSPA